MNISTILPSLRTVSLVSGAICVPAALEMALRSIKDVGDLFSAETREKGKKHISANLGGAVFYGLCATNLIPGTPIVGAALFTAYALFAQRKDEYLTAKAVREICIWTHDNVIQPAWENVVYPVAMRIYDFIVAVLARIRLPRHPIWYGVALLATAIWFKYGTDLPALMADIRNRLV